MIRFAKKEDTEGIIQLWQEAFGDSREEISAILYYTLEHTVVYEENGQVSGMLSLLPVKYKEKSGFYVYAVATLKEYRGRGNSTALLNFAKERECDFLVLVPQNDKLFEFYKKRGFHRIDCIKKSHVMPKKGDEFIFKPISAEEYYVLRQRYCPMRLIVWSEEMLGLAKTLYGGELLKIEKNGRECGAAFFFKHQKMIYIKELLTKEEPEAVAQGLGYEYGANAVEYATLGQNKFAMIYPKPDKEIYFNIALD